MESTDARFVNVLGMVLIKVWCNIHNIKLAQMFGSLLLNKTIKYPDFDIYIIFIILMET